MDDQRLSQTISDLMRAKSLDIEKLAQMTGVSDRYLQFLLEEKFNKLPAAPYVRGYLMRISQVLGLDSEKVWQEYLRDNESLNRAGKEDRMPENRFVSKSPISKTTIALVALGLIAALAIVRAVYINNPKVEFQNLKDDITIVKESNFTIKGKLDPAYKLTLNNEEIILGGDGAFEKEVILEPNFNNFTFKAKKLLGKEHQISKQIFYQEPQETLSPEPVPAPSFEETTNLNQNGPTEETNEGF